METESEFIKRSALEEGFDLVGIAAAEALAPEAERLEEWIRLGYHATMRWMADNRDKRRDPRLVLPGARSVISLAKNYYVPVVHREATAKISRYAWGDDYHVILGDKLKRLAARLAEKFEGRKFLWYCDTGPVMDKVWAQRAGIGWIGKHTNVINQSMGSWMFLAEIITDLECGYDAPAADHCGSCRACIDACPTQAIVEPYVLDANRCISFLTIENRDDEIPDMFAGKMEGWIFGCDICQDVCPWNEKFQTATDEPGFSPRPENLNLNAAEAHLMTREEFSTRYRRSPVKRAKYDGFLRNARALGHSG